VTVRSGDTTAMLGAVKVDDFGRQRLADLIAEGSESSGIVVSTDGSNQDVIGRAALG
jgi:sugar/nucleoside kinase (ribokinase family)